MIAYSLEFKEETLMPFDIIIQRYEGTNTIESLQFMCIGFGHQQRSNSRYVYNYKYSRI